MVVAASSMKLLREVVADENAELVLSAVFCADLCSDYPLLWALALLGNRVNSSLKAGQVQMPVPLVVLVHGWLNRPAIEGNPRHQKRLYRLRSMAREEIHCH